MKIATTIKSLGLLLMCSSTTMLPPILVGHWYKEDNHLVFIISAGIIFFTGLLLWTPFRRSKSTGHSKEGFLIVVLFWVVLCFVGAIPFFLSYQPSISFVDSVYESVSGLTATGATVLTGLDYLPRSILYYRQQLQLLGGMGIILLAIAVLPALGIGGMQLFKAEMTGPGKDNKLTPRIAQSAKAIWMIYFGTAVFCAVAYWAAGMELFDAIGYSFGTVSTGGFATHDLSVAYFNNPNMQLIAVVFMLIGSISFSLHFISLTSGNFKVYWHDQEFKAFMLILTIATILVAFVLGYHQVYENPKTIIIESLFQVVSLATTTGFSSAIYAHWPIFIPALLLLLGLVGGCSGSTSGGIKIIRLLLLHKQGIREIKRLIHPNAHYVIKLGHTALSDRVINAIWGYFATYVAMFGLFLLLFLTTGLDFLTAWSATTASLSNIGPGLGEVATSYQSMNDSAKIMMSFAMLIGRLEFFTILVLLTPTYWRS